MNSGKPPPARHTFLDTTSNSNILLPEITESTRITDFVQNIHEQTGQYAALIGFATYILKNDLSETKDKLKDFFRNLLPEDIEDYIKHVITPKFRATLIY